MILLPKGYEWYIDKAHKWRFREVGANDEIIYESPAYRTEKACMDGIVQREEQRMVESRIEQARCLMSSLRAEEFLLTVGQPVALGREIIAQKSRDGTIVLYEVVE